MTQPRDSEPWVTLPAPGQQRDSQLHVTDAAAIPTNRHTCTCIFPGERIAVAHVIGARSQDVARAAVQAMWYPCRYEVLDGDLSRGHTPPFSLRLNEPEPMRYAWLLRNAEGEL